jgi:large subunit ribosomal protein L31
MKKDVHPKIQLVQFKCATCGSTYEFNSTNKSNVVNLDVCSNCHPFYKGIYDNKGSKSINEKLSAKFAKGKANIKK